MWPQYIGAGNIGRIRGLALLFGLGLSAVAGPATGLVHDATGSYVEAWTAATILLAAVAVIILFTPKPSRPPEPSDKQSEAVTAS